MERASANFAETPTIGEVTLGCVLGYLDFRGVCADWRETPPGPCRLERTLCPLSLHDRDGPAGLIVVANSRCVGLSGGV